MVARNLRPYLMVAPALIILTVFSLYPIFHMVGLSFFKWNMMSDMEFVGLRNYEKMMFDPEFQQVLGNSVYFMVVGVVCSVSMALGLAIFLRRKIALNRFLQAVVFSPHVISLVSISFIWIWFMDTDFGLLNYLLSGLGVTKIGWLDDPSVALNSLIIVAVWKNLGYDTLIILAGLQSIPSFLYEAAALDRTGPLKVFRKITLPMVSPTLFFVALINIIGYFKVFETVNIMTQGGPINSTNTLVHYLYQYGFQFFKIGYASAVGVVLLVIIGACTIVYFRVLARQVHYR